MNEVFIARWVPLLEQELSTLPENLSSPSVLVGFVLLELHFYVKCFVDLCWPFFFWPLCCLSFIDLWILIIPLVSSNSLWYCIIKGLLHAYYRAPDKLRICVFYVIKTSKNACIIRSECTHYAYILLCKQTFQIRSVLVRW